MGPKTAAVVDLVRANPGKTARELSALAGQGSAVGRGNVESLLGIAAALGLVRSVRAEFSGKRPRAEWFVTDAPMPEAATKRAKLPPADPYRLMSEAVERGVAYGWRRAHKHTDSPTDDAGADAIREAVMSEIAEAFVFPETR